MPYGHAKLSTLVYTMSRIFCVLSFLVRPLPPARVAARVGPCREKSCLQQFYPGYLDVQRSYRVDRLLFRVTAIYVMLRQCCRPRLGADRTPEPRFGRCSF
ncbi:hypothetical protein F4679DRAFT_315134 [Xylaria curta]|nr:hypothetical protein F4679DRAFT_315134 [Xylaria curta]